MIRLVLLAVAVPVVAQAQTDPAVDRIQRYQRAVEGVMDQGARLGPAGRAGRFEAIVRDHFDLSAAARLIAGPAWARATDTDRSAVVAALARYNAAQHAANFRERGGARFGVDPQTAARGGDRLVRATVGGDVLIYRMRLTDGRWRIVDVVARGVSQLAVQRADLAGTVRTGGVPAMAAKLDELARRSVRGR